MDGTMMGIAGLAMTYDANPTPLHQDRPMPVGPARPSMLQHVLRMPRFHKKLLTLAMLLAGAGGVGQIVGQIPASTDSAIMSSRPGASPSGSNSIVQTSDTAAPASSETSPSLNQRVSPAMTKIGLSFIAGFVLGWVFRAFLKLASMIGAAGIAILMGLSWLRIVNIDLSQAQQEYNSAMAWMNDQAWILAKNILSHIPGSASTFAGLYVGFKRK
jgi:uncharacterized membrane protein (Fun14 family)